MTTASAKYHIPKYPGGGWGATTYGPNIAETPLDQNWQQYYQQQSTDKYNTTVNYYDDALKSYYDETNAANKQANLNSLYGQGAKLGVSLQKAGSWEKYKSKFGMQYPGGKGAMTSMSEMQSYSPEMVAEMKAAGTLPADATAIQKAPWSLAGQKAAQWSMGTSVGKVGTAIAPYAPFAAIAGKGLQMAWDDKKPETYTFKEGTAGFVSGAATGAMIGSTVLPGIGTVAGAVIGGVVSIFTGKARAKKYQEYLDDLDAYNKKKEAFDVASKEYKDTTTMYGSAPIMKNYWEN